MIGRMAVIKAQDYRPLVPLCTWCSPLTATSICLWLREFTGGYYNLQMLLAARSSWWLLVFIDGCLKSLVATCIYRWLLEFQMLLVFRDGY